MTVDVAVVGGGPSGLFAALGLIRAFDGLKVKVTASSQAHIRPAANPPAS